MRTFTSFRRLLPLIVLAPLGGGCFTGMVRDAAEEQRGPAELFGKPAAVFVAADGALAIETQARYRPESARWPARTRYVVIDPEALRAKLERAASSRHADRDAEGRVIVEVRYPGGTIPVAEQVYPRKFDAPDATDTDLPLKFRQGTRIDWAVAPQFRVHAGGASHLMRGLSCRWEGRRYLLVPVPGESERRGPRRGIPVEVILGPPAVALDVLTLPIQVPVWLIAVYIMVG